MNVVINRTNEFLVNGDAAAFYTAAVDLDHILIFDPPFEIADQFEFMRNSKNVLAFCDGYRAYNIVKIFGPPTWVFVWDCISSWFTPSRPLKRVKLCFWYGDINNYSPKGHLFGEKSRHCRLVKNSRGSYWFQPDAGGKMLSDLYAEPITQLHNDDEHSHKKPFDWMCALIANTIPDGAVVVDPFAGSGVTLAVSRHLNIPWFGSEIDVDCCNQIDANATPPMERLGAVNIDMFSQKSTD